MNRPEDQVLVIFGASGDLTKRMLMPSLYELHVRQMLPERFVILGTSRKSMSDEEFRLSIRLMLEELKGEKGLNGEEVNRFLQKVKIHDTPLREKIAKPDIMILIQQINITPLGPSPLTRSIGKSVTRPSRNTDRVREINLFIHQKIQRSGSKDASHPATFKH